MGSFELLEPVTLLSTDADAAEPAPAPALPVDPVPVLLPIAGDMEFGGSLTVLGASTFRLQPTDAAEANTRHERNAM